MTIFLNRLGLLLVASIFIYSGAHSQTDPEPADDEEDDFSAYANAQTADGSKSYATSKVLGLSPQKLISVGYDVQGPYTLESGAFSTFSTEKTRFSASHGLRLLANFPVISYTKWLVNIGAQYTESQYVSQEKTSPHPFNQTLLQNGLRSMGVNATVFKPFNAKYYIITQLAGDFNGDLPYFALPSFNQLKISAVAAFGIKKHDRSMFALGLSRTYRGGGLLYIPVLMYNYTYPSRKWGYEVLLPARAAVRYTLNSRNMFFAGFELEGAAYRLNNLMKKSPTEFTALELKRSEIRTKIAYEFSVHNFIWLSVNAGYRINYRFHVDNGDTYRSIFDNTPYTMENQLKNALYANVSINLVSP